MSKQHGHYCRICQQRKANEKFSGKGHAAHICKACAKRGNKPPDFEPDVAYIEDEEAFFAAYEFPLDIIPEFDEPHKQKPVKQKKIKSPQKVQAKEFLAEILADGAKSKNEIIKSAEKIGIPLQVLRLAKGSLGVHSEMTDNGSVWFLPSPLKKNTERQ